jgi:catechol 2,3-dioxygenase-like lactoylglutathione lyase family enzyme
VSQEKEDPEAKGVSIMPQPIHHIAILVPNLEEAMGRWSRATGYDFGPIKRYRTAHYIDHSSAEAHPHDARISHSLQGNPLIELVETTGEGTHSSTEVGVHHIAFLNITDIDGAYEEQQAAGFPVDGASYVDGRLHLFLTDKASLDGVRLEFVAHRPGPMVADDGGPIGTTSETEHPNVASPPDTKPAQ